MSTEGSPLLLRGRAPIGSPCSPLPGVYVAKPARRYARVIRWLGLKDETEARLVLRLVFMGALANIAFVFGRNAAPALYIARLGSRRLARGMFLSC